MFRNQVINNCNYNDDISMQFNLNKKKQYIIQHKLKRQNTTVHNTTYIKKCKINIYLCIKQ